MVSVLPLSRQTSETKSGLSISGQSVSVRLAFFYYGTIIHMESKKLIWFGMTVGTVIGGYLPLLWDGSTFSFSSIFLAMIGGIVGIIVGFKLSQF